jgi:hypothetical protein
MADDPLDRERPGQQPRRRAGIARRQRLAHPARRDGFAIEQHRGDRFSDNPRPGAKLGQDRSIACPPRAKGEIIARDHARRADPLAQQAGHKFLGTGRRQFPVEAEDHHRIGPGLPEQALALVQAGQPERRRVGLEVAHRVGVEGRDDHRPSFMRAALHRAPDHRLVAKVKAVEIAQRQDCAAQGFRYRRIEGQPLHRRLA